MGNSPLTEEQHKIQQIKNENAELRQRFKNLNDQKTILENDIKLKNIILRSKEQANVKKEQKIIDMNLQIINLQKQKETNLIQFDEVKEQITKLQSENKNKTETLKEKQSIKHAQDTEINNMKNEMHELQKQKEEMKYNIDLVKYLECKDVEYPILLKLKDHNLFRNCLAKFDQVILIGLKNRPKWNGKTAKIIGNYDAIKNRWPVKLLDKTSGKGNLKPMNLVLHKAGKLSKISIGSTITITEISEQHLFSKQYVFVGYPYNGWFSASSDVTSTITKQIKAAYLKDEKLSIIGNILQLNDENITESLLVRNNWDVQQAIDNYYFDEFKEETNKIKYNNVWEWFDDDMNWKAYTKELNKCFDNLEIGKIYNFSHGCHKYIFHKISSESGEQINSKTNKKRRTKRIKVKHNDGSMYPLFWSDEGCTYHDFNNNDLYYMSSEILPIEEDYIKPKYEYLDMKSNMANEIINAFYLTASRSQCNIIKIASLQNRWLWDKYYAAKTALKKSIGKDKLNERNLWHGTDTDTIQKISMLGFRKE
eukprot:323860_1